MGGVVAASFLASFIMSRIPLFDRLSDSMKISLLTVLIAGAAALLFPIKEKDGAGDRTDERQEREVKGHDA